MRREFVQRTTRSARRMMLVALLAVLGVAVWAAFTAFAASGPPTPTITSPPANPASSTSATLTYTSSGATSFVCKLDAAGSFTACVNSGITYTGLAQGSHTFQVEASDKNGHLSSAASYTWVIDTTAPTVSSISRADPNPTKAAALHWTVTFSEPVKNVATSNFSPLGTSNLGGDAPSITSATPSGAAPTASWTVTVNTTGTTGTDAGSIQLNLTSKGTIQDAAGNGLGGSVPVPGAFYTFDTARPALISIAAPAATTRTSAASVSWTVTFSESMSGLSTSNFSLSTTGITGAAVVSSVSGSGTGWTVTASTGTGTPSGSGTVTLDFANATSVTDLAGNTLNATLPTSGPTYTAVDHLAPPVAFGKKPPDPNSVSTSNFTWASTPWPGDFDHYQCSTENGPFSTIVQSASGPSRPCASPLSYVVATTNNGQHQFAVRAYDTTHNYAQISYSWKVAAGSIQSFTISGSLAPTDLLYPGGAIRTIPVTLTNPNSVQITITKLVVTVDPTSLPAGCQVSWFQITPSNISTTDTPAATVNVSAQNSVTLPAQGATAPTISMTNSGEQNACHGATFTLTYSGSAHS